LFNIFFSDGECVVRDIGCSDFGIFAIFSDGDGDAAGTGAEVADELRFGLFSEEFDCLLDEQFCFRSGDKAIGCNYYRYGVEFCFSDEVLDRFAFGGVFYQAVEFIELLLLNGLVEFGVKANAFSFEDVAYEHFGTEPRCVESLLGEVFGNPV